MSAREILAELPKLSPADLQLVWCEAAQLLDGQTLSASPELLKAIDLGDASAAAEKNVLLEQARETVRSWTTK